MLVSLAKKKKKKNSLGKYQALTRKGIQIESSIEKAVKYPRILSTSSSLARDSVTL